MKTIRTLAVGLLAVTALAAIAAPSGEKLPAAKSLLAKAQDQAKTEHKNVLLIFHASWCGWCHKLDDMLKSPEVGGLVEKGLVVTHVDVMEQPAKKDLENGGGNEMMKQYTGGVEAGLPFFLIMTPSGKVLGNSLAPKTGNIGYPAEPAEVAHFMGMLNKGAPNLNADDKVKIEAYLHEAAAKIKAASNGGH